MKYHANKICEVGIPSVITAIKAAKSANIKVKKRLMETAAPLLRDQVS